MGSSARSSRPREAILGLLLAVLLLSGEAEQPQAPAATVSHPPALGPAAAAPIGVEVSQAVQVAREGEEVTVQCRVGRELQYCRVEQVAPTPEALRRGRTSWNLMEGLQAGSDGVAYAGAGLRTGQCGVTIRPLRSSFNGRYRCTLGIPGSTDEGFGFFNITVAVPPKSPELSMLRTEPGGRGSSGSGYGGRDYGGGPGSSQELVEGQRVTFRCAVRDGRPRADILWFMDDQQVTRGLSTPLVAHQAASDLYSVEQNLTLEAGWRDHGKTLRCVASHVALDERNNQTTLPINVRFAPRSHSEIIGQFGFVIGAPGEISVEVNANPRPTVSWIIDEVTIAERQKDPAGRLEAASLMNNGSGSWTAVLRISDVAMQDIERQYRLRASNDLGSEIYTIRLSTSSEPTVMPLEAGTIIGIVVAILVLLLAIFLIVFARTTGRWCFAGGVSKQDPKESSDTESADHGPTHSSKKAKGKFSNIFKKKGDKVGDDPPATKEVDSPVARPAQQQTQAPQQAEGQRTGSTDNIVYAELDLKELGDRRPQVRPDEERTEYAEILYTAKPTASPEHTSPPQP